MIRIVYAGYGAAKTYDVTEKITYYYNNGARTFNIVDANNTFGDPDFGNTKALFIVWENGAGIVSAAATENGNIKSITLPD